jgi:two-component system, response regulator RpfG
MNSENKEALVAKSGEMVMGLTEHVAGVTAIAIAITRVMKDGLDEDEVRRAALLHDVGKLATPWVFNLTRRLSPAENNLARLHPATGERWALERGEPLRVREGILYHQEKYNGSGYPFGLAGNEIPLMARVLQAADVYEALAAERPYKPSWKPIMIEVYFHLHGGEIFDPRIAALVVNNFQVIHMALMESREV